MTIPRLDLSESELAGLWTVVPIPGGKQSGKTYAALRALARSAPSLTGVGAAMLDLARTLPIGSMRHRWIKAARDRIRAERRRPA